MTLNILKLALVQLYLWQVLSVLVRLGRHLVLLALSVAICFFVVAIIISSSSDGCESSKILSVISR